MSKVVKDLLHYLEGTKGGWQPTLTVFPETDIRQVADDLDLAEKAAAARAGTTQTQAESGTDLTELEILEDIQQRARIAGSDYVSQMDLYEARLRDSAVDDAAYVRIKAVAEQALTNYRGQLAEDRLPLAAASERFQRMRRHFDHFVRCNRLENFAPVVRDRQELARGWLWIAVIVALETVLNGFFFATGSELGLVGGITEALVLSVLNVSVAGALGLFAVRYARHVRLIWKLTGIIAFALCIAVLLALNVVIAHYREAFALAAGSAIDFRTVLESVRIGPWNLQDPKSWLLGAFGIVLGTFAAYKMHGLLDPYPGFGRIAARLEEETQRFGDLQRDVIQVLSDHRDIALDEMAEIVSALSARRHEFELALRGRERLRDLFRAHLDGLERAADRLRLMYREMAGLESGAVSPTQLGKPPEVLSSFSADDSSHQRAIDAMDSYIRRMSEEYRNAVDEVGPVMEEAPRA